MNEVLEVIGNRRSVRAYEDKPISAETRDTILSAAMRAPTAGNLMLYSIIEVRDQAAKDTLAVSCDNQPFIAKAPLVLLFLADYQRWYDYFLDCGVEASCQAQGVPMRRPEEGDLFLACCDALIAAQTAVIAAESLGVGSCYIGDIMEKYEVHRELFDLPQYVFPICLLCFGYPTEAAKGRQLTSRLDQRFVVFESRYRRLTHEEFEDLFKGAQRDKAGAPVNIGQLMYERKFSADFSEEMSRSVRAILASWTGREAHPVAGEGQPD